MVGMQNNRFILIFYAGVSCFFSSSRIYSHFLHTGFVYYGKFLNSAFLLRTKQISGPPKTEKIDFYLEKERILNENDHHICKTSKINVFILKSKKSKKQKFHLWFARHFPFCFRCYYYCQCFLCC